MLFTRRTYRNEELKIFLKDKAGNSINEREVNHEKLMRLIIVDDH
jgi:hypothetical protein